MTEQEREKLYEKEKNEKFYRYFKTLEGITYLDWGKLKQFIDECFKSEISKQTKDLPLAENELLKNRISSIP